MEYNINRALNKLLIIISGITALLQISIQFYEKDFTLSNSYHSIIWTSLFIILGVKYLITINKR